MTRPAFVQTEFDFAIREINALEVRIVTAEDDADAMLWEQARQVVQYLDANPRSASRVARQWINARRKGQPYSERHVRIVKQVFNSYLNTNPRPRFRDAYNEIANAGPVNRINFNSGDNEWYTPPAIIEAAKAILGPIDLDPSSCELANTVVGAKQFYDKDADGLRFPWQGTVWMNPPYDQPAITNFALKFAGHVRAGGITAGMVFVNNGTETKWFQAVAEVSGGDLFSLVARPPLVSRRGDDLAPPGLCPAVCRAGRRGVLSAIRRSGPGAGATMTRAYRGLVSCPRCGLAHSAESAFERWMRGEPTLDSREAGIVRFDCDVLLHRYCITTDKKSSRALQCLMFVEVKTHDAEPTDAQRDTLKLFAQVLRNRRRNMHSGKHGLHAEDHLPLALAFSWLQGRDVRIKMFGGHLLQLSGDDPTNSDRLRWDYRGVTRDQLLALLRFELDPDTLRPIDWRRRYSAFDEPTLFGPRA